MKTEENPVPEKIALVHYFYFLKSSEEAFRQAWANLVSSWKLKEDISAGELRAKVQSGQPSIIGSVTGDNIKMKCVYFKDVIAIEVFFSSPNIQPDNQVELWLTHLQTLEQKKKEWEKLSSSLVGETTLLVSSTTDHRKTTEQVELVFPQVKLVRTELKIGLLMHLALPDKDNEHRHYYSYLPNEDSNILEFLSKQFIVPDVLTQIVKRKADFYFKQSLSLKKAREEVDRVIKDILHRPAAKIEHPTIRLMEDELEKLSSNYTGLADSANLLKQSYTETEKEVETLQEEIDKLEVSKFQVNGFHSLYIAPIKEMIESFKTEAKLQQESLHNAKTAIEIIRTQVELARGGQSLLMQEQTILLMVAGGFIEFMMIFYYTLHTWNILIGQKRFENLAAPVRFMLAMFLAGAVVTATYFVAEAIREKKLNQGLMYSAGVTLTMLFIMVILTTFFA